MYNFDNLTWEVAYSVKIRSSNIFNRRMTLVIHLPSDGYFYINGTQMEEFLPLEELS